jgi:hypothetical protein
MSGDRTYTAEAESSTWNCTAGTAPTESPPASLERLPAMTAATWHHRATGQPTTRSLIAYDSQ